MAHGKAQVMSEGRRRNQAARRAVRELLDYSAAQGYGVGGASLYVRMVILEEIDAWKDAREEKQSSEGSGGDEPRREPLTAPNVLYEPGEEPWEE